MTSGVTKGFVRVASKRPPLQRACVHPNFEAKGKCTKCGYDLWSQYVRRQIRALEVDGVRLTEEERVREVISIITAPLIPLDDFRYIGILPRLPRRLKVVSAGSKSENHRVRRAIEVARLAAQRMHTTIQLVEASQGQLEALGLDEDEIWLLKRELVAFLDAYMLRFRFPIDEADLWPLILGYAARIGRIEPDEVAGNYFLDSQRKLK
jgi:hypothetical protein